MAKKKHLDESEHNKLVPVIGPLGKLAIGMAVARDTGKYFRNRMYNTIRPTGYKLNQVKNFIKNNKRNLREDLNTEALYGKYTGQDSIIGDAEDFIRQGITPPGRKLSERELDSLGIYYLDSNTYRKAAVSDLIHKSPYRPNSYELVYPSISDISNTPVEGDVQQPHSHSLGTYTLRTKRSNLGGYNEYIDSWDINPFKGVSAEDDKEWKPIIKAGRAIGLNRFEDIIPFGKPFNIYGRRYHNDR